MADYARRGDQARGMRSVQAQVQRLRTRRPRRGHVPVPGWTWFGVVDDLTYFPPALILLDPAGNDEYPEHKQIIGFDGFVLSGGSLTLDWQHVGIATILADHFVEGPSSRVLLDDPYIVDLAVSDGLLLQPEITDHDGAEHVSLFYIVETVPA